MLKFGNLLYNIYIAILNIFNFLLICGDINNISKNIINKLQFIYKLLKGGNNLDIFIYDSYKHWKKDKPLETLEGDIEILNDKLIVIDTYHDNKPYRQILSLENIFAIAYKMPYSHLALPKEINFYEYAEEWTHSDPSETILGEVNEYESNSNFISFISNVGYKEYVSLNKLFAVVYER